MSDNETARRENTIARIIQMVADGAVDVNANYDPCCPNCGAELWNCRCQYER